MGFYDRDYYRNEPPPARGGLGGVKFWPLTTWLIVVNVAVYVLNNMLPPAQVPVFGRVVEIPALSLWGWFSGLAAIEHLQVWRFISFQFLHAGLAHLAFNMIAIYFFGPMVLAYLGARRFVAFYLLCGIAGAVGYLALYGLGVTLAESGLVSETWQPWLHWNSPMVGASAGVFGILIAAARIAPDARVMLMIPPIPMRLRTLAWVLLGIALFTVIMQGQNAGGEAAHLGGAALGAVFIRWPRLLNIFDFSLRRRGGGWERYR